MISEFETWPATPVEASLEVNELTLRLGLAGVASFQTNEAAGVGRPSSNIANCQLPIADFKRGSTTPIGNRKSAIGN